MARARQAPPPPQPGALPPQNLDAEESVLGAMMLSSAAIETVAGLLAPTDFYRESHGRIFRIALEMFNRGEPVDVLTLADTLHREKALDDVGGKPRLHEIAALVPAASNVAHYCRIVREMASLRALARAGGELNRLALDRGGTIPELLAAAERLVGDLSSTYSEAETGLLPAGPRVEQVYQDIMLLHETGAEPPGLNTGFVDLDKKLVGMQDGNLIVLAARPSMGKTALGLGVVANILIRRGLPVALFTLEMSVEEVIQRMLASEGRAEPQLVRSGRIPDEGWGRLIEAANTLSGAPFYIDTNGLLTTAAVRAEVRKLKARVPELALVMVDYLQLMASASSEESRVQQVTQISRDLKLIAHDFEVPVLALSQLSRAVESRHDKRPLLSDLRDSGSIEQDADVVLFIYRDEYYNPEDTDQNGIAEVNIAKHRNGPTGTVKLSFLKRFARFGDLTLHPA